MNIIAINGSPRKGWNTAKLLEYALDGAKSVGATTEIVHLYDLNFKGCVSCFACKRKNNPKLCHCYYKDDLSPVLERIMSSDGLLLGSPNYLGNVTGEMRAFMERLVFMNLNYDDPSKSLFGGKINSAFFFTMNVPQEYKEYSKNMIESNSQQLRILNGSVETLASYDTYQFDDYSKYHAGIFDEAQKAKIRDEQFPLDCESAYKIGVNLATPNNIT